MRYGYLAIMLDGEPSLADRLASIIMKAGSDGRLSSS